MAAMAIAGTLRSRKDPLCGTVSRPLARIDWIELTLRRVSYARIAVLCVEPVSKAAGSRVAANGRPLGRAGDLAVMRERFAEHPSGLFADRTRQPLLSKHHFASLVSFVVTHR